MLDNGSKPLRIGQTRRRCAVNSSSALLAADGKCSLLERVNELRPFSSMFCDMFIAGNSEPLQCISKIGSFGLCQKRCDCTPNTVWLHSNTSCRACQQAIQWFFCFAQNRGNYFGHIAVGKWKTLWKAKKETVWFQLVRWMPYGFTVYRKITQRVSGFVLYVFFQIRTGSEVIRFLCEWVLFCKKERISRTLNLTCS